MPLTEDRQDAKPEIEPYYWKVTDSYAQKEHAEFFQAREKPDSIILDPPYFEKKAQAYPEKGISMLPKKEYLEFFEGFFALLKQYTMKTTRLAFIKGPRCHQPIYNNRQTTLT